jgi:hypothetical protein
MRLSHKLRNYSILIKKLRAKEEFCTKQLAVIMAIGYIYRISEDISSESEAQNK